MEEKNKKTSATKQAKIDALLKELSNSNISKVKLTLEALKLYGDPSILPRAIKELTLESHSEKNNAIIEFLSCLKDAKARSVMMNLVQDAEYIAYRQILLSTLWNSPLDYTDYLEVFVDLAIKGDFMITLECLTIIENLDGPFSEKSVMESQVLLGNYAETNPDKSSQKGGLISEIALLIQDFQRLVDSED